MRILYLLATEPVFRILTPPDWISIQLCLGINPDPDKGGKNDTEKKFVKFQFYGVLDVFFGGLETSPVA
jgi:hypothetical protein